MKALRRFARDLQLFDLTNRSAPISWLIQTLRLFYYLFDELVRDKCLQTAASLAFTTLLGLVPVLAISLSIVSRVKFSQESFQRFLFEHLFPSISAQTIIMESIQKFSQNVATLSVLGLLFLAAISISLLNTVEGAFNAIWRVAEKRSLVSKFTSFWSVITFSPILVASSIFLSGKLGETTIGGVLLRYPYFETLVTYGLPNAMIFAAVFFMYWMLPYTKVRTFPAVIGSITATLLFQLARRGFEFYITKFATYDRVYGILGALPVFLMWIYLSWVVVLFGAEVVYTLQYYRAPAPEKPKAWDAGRYDGYYALRVVMAVAERFGKGLEPISVTAAAEHLNATVDSLENVLVKLRDARIVASIDEARQQYVPIKDPGVITPMEIIASLGAGTFMVPPLPEDIESDRIRGLFSDAQEAANRILRSKSVGDLLSISESEAASEERDQKGA